MYDPISQQLKKVAATELEMKASSGMYITDIIVNINYHYYVSSPKYCNYSAAQPKKSKERVQRTSDNESAEDVVVVNVSRVEKGFFQHFSFWPTFIFNMYLCTEVANDAISTDEIDGDDESMSHGSTNEPMNAKRGKRRSGGIKLKRCPRKIPEIAKTGGLKISHSFLSNHIPTPLVSRAR